MVLCQGILFQQSVQHPSEVGLHKVRICLCKDYSNPDKSKIKTTSDTGLDTGLGTTKKIIYIILETYHCFYIAIALFQATRIP